MITTNFIPVVFQSYLIRNQCKKDSQTHHLLSVGLVRKGVPTHTLLTHVWYDWRILEEYLDVSLEVRRSMGYFTYTY